MFNHRVTVLGIIGIALLVVCLVGFLLMGAAGWFLTQETTVTAGDAAAETGVKQFGMGVVPRSTPTKLLPPIMMQSRSASTPTPTPLPLPVPVITSTLLVTSAAQISTEAPGRSASVTKPISETISGSVSETISGSISETVSEPTITPTPTAPPAIVPVSGQENMATRLVIPKLDLDATVLPAPIENQTWRVDHLDQTIGHLEGTAPPGSDSNMVLAGHVTLATGVPGPFITLNQLAPGDFIIVYRGDEAFQYVVDTQQVVDRTSVEVAYPSAEGQVTLITCTTWSSEQGRYQNRLVVKARLVGN